MLPMGTKVNLTYLAPDTKVFRTEALRDVGSPRVVFFACDRACAAGRVGPRSQGDRERARSCAVRRGREPLHGGVGARLPTLLRGAELP